MSDLLDYMKEFELRVVGPGLCKGIFGRREFVSVRRGKLASTLYGRVLGNQAESNQLFAIVYYGHIKKSRGLVLDLQQIVGRQIKMAETLVVHFGSIRIEDVAVLAPDLIGYFPKFKEQILSLRGFKCLEGD